MASGTGCFVLRAILQASADVRSFLPGCLLLLASGQQRVVSR